jgi:hypothetical protein
MRTRFIAGWLFFLAALLPAAEELHLSGYDKSFFNAFFPAAIRFGNRSEREPALGSLSNRLRLQLDYRPGKWFSLQLAYDLTPEIVAERLRQGDPIFPAPDPGSYRWKDLPAALYPGANAAAGTFSLRQNLDRLNFQIAFPWASLTVGRQVVAWGSARVISPTDVIAPFSFHELDVEDRRGVDAVRLRVPAGELQELDLGWISGSDGEAGRSAWYFRGRFNSWKTDWSLLLMSFRRHFLLGADMSRSLGGAGIWLEAAYVRNHLDPGDPAATPRGYFRASTGIEYFFSDRFSGFCEYHFNTAGAGTAQNYEADFSLPAYRDGAVYLLGRHYLCLGGIVHVHPLMPLSLLAIGNLGDRSLELSPTLEYNLSQNIYLSIGAYIGLGKKAQAAASISGPDSLLFHSEFGAYPDMVFTSFRVYF